MPVDKYFKTDIQGQSFLYELHFVRDKWEVWCWRVELENGREEPPYVDIEHHWTVEGVVTGYKDNNPNFEIRRPFMEEEARAEFEKWRK